MRASWFALHASFHRVLNRTSAEAEFKAMGHLHPELAAFATIPALMEHQRAPTADRAARFRVIRALVAAAQSDQSYRSTAQVMVIIALWPGLDAVFWRLARGFPAARFDLASEILSRLSEAIATIDLEKVTAVTATLLRNLERDIRRAFVDERVRSQAFRPLDDPATAADVMEAVAEEVGDVPDVADILVGIAPDDANLLRRVFVLGETQEEAGHAFGLRPDAARKRIQRSVNKLRTQHKSPPALSHSCPPTGL